MAPKSVPVPMIRRVRLHNFRSIADCDVELGPLTLLVGPNGSGKSNFLHALDFLSDALNNGLDSAVRRRGGMNSLLSRWALNDPDATLRIEVELDLAERMHGYYFIELKRDSAGGYRSVREVCYVRNADWSLLANFSFEEGEAGTYDTTGLNDAKFTRVFTHPGRGLVLAHYAEHRYVRFIYEAIRGISCYSFNVDEMRRPQEVDGGERLKPDGSNVASVLERLSEKNDYGWTTAGRIDDYLAAVSPGIETAYTADLDGYRAVRFRRRGAKGEAPWDFTASEASYGTLRMLGVFVAISQGLMPGGSPVTLVGIEEPENAVHPGAATAILEAMDEASLSMQIIATTHSVAMLDHEDFDVDILRAVAEVNGRTLIGPIDAASRQIIEDALNSAGQLLDMSNLEPEAFDEVRRQGEAAARA